MKIGVYGGSFNPCHLMHKKMVETLLNNGVVDKIIILPTGNFYKKSNLLKGEERKKMLEIMFKNNPNVIVSDYEFKNNLICTYRSLDYLQSIYKDDTLYFILGGDNIKQFNSWKRYEYILDTYNLLVIKRKNYDIKEDIEKYSKYKGEIISLDLDLDSTSSSNIRYLISEEDESYKDLIDENVYEYIKQKGFYRKDYIEKDDDILISDEEFLSKYSSDDYEKMSITTDITLFGISNIEKDNYRKNDKKAFSVLLVKRNTPPFMGKWCLPGGFLSLDETLIDCAKRVLFIETNLDEIYLEQLYTFSDIDRDIRGRVLSCSYMGLVDKGKVEDKLKPSASFFDINMNQINDEITLTFQDKDEKFVVKAKEVTNNYGIVSYKEIQNDYLAFDNLQVIITSIKRLQSKINYTSIVFHMMKEEFTLKELQLVYETILDKKMLDPVFRRSIASLVEPTEKFKIDGGHRPARLYRYKGDQND